MRSDEPLDGFIKNGILELDNLKADDELKAATLRLVARADRKDMLVAEYSRKIRLSKLRSTFFKAGATLAMLSFLLSAVVSVCWAESSPISEESKQASVKNSVQTADSTPTYVYFDQTFGAWSNRLGSTIPILNIESPEGIIGVWNDNSNWNSAFNINFIDTEFDSYNAFQNNHVNFNNRIKVNVVTNNGEPVGGAYVNGYNDFGELVYSAISDNEGVAYLFGNLLSSEASSRISYVNVSIAGKTISCEVNTDDITAILDLPDENTTEKTLDLMFVVSTRESMYVAFNALSGSIERIVEKIRKNYADINIRLSVNFYRDGREEYLVRSFPFYDDPQIAIDILKKQECFGGVDYEDWFDIALYDAVFSHEWSDEAHAKLLFILCDSPPHQTQGVRDSIIESTRAAAMKGIRIIPITSGVTDKVTEYVSRSIAVATGGTYAFFAYPVNDDNSLKSTVGDCMLYTFPDGIYSIIENYIK